MSALVRLRSVVLVAIAVGVALLVALGVSDPSDVGIAGAAGAARSTGARAPHVGARLARLAHGHALVAAGSSRFSTTYRLADGSMVTRVSPSPVNFRDRSGRWRAIDDTLVARGGGYGPRADGHSLALPRRLSSGVQVASGRDRISMRLRGADGTASVRGARAEYRNVLPGTSVLYDSQPSGLREQLVLSESPAPRSFSFALTTTRGLQAHMTRAGAVIFSRGRRRVFVMPPSIAYPQGHESDVHPVRSELRRTVQGWTLTVTPNGEWLERALSHGPVVVDPTLEIDPDSQDCFIESDTPTTNYCSSAHLSVGYDGTNDQRGLVQFDLSALPKDAVILNADFGLTLGGHSTNNTKQVGVYRVLQPWNNSATWNKYDATHSWGIAGAAGSGDASSTAAAVVTTGTGSGFVDWYPTKLVQDWVSGSVSNYGLLVRDVTPNTTANELDFSTREGGSVTPELDIVWAPRTGALGSYTFDTQQLTDRSNLSVNIANGNLLLSSSDLHVAGTGLDLDLTRFHNSMGTDFGDQGMGIPGTMSLGRDVHLQSFADGSVAYYQGDGVVLPFLDRTVSGSTASFTPPKDLNATLTQDTSSGVYTLTLERPGLVQTFNSSGQLTSVKDQNANTISLSYYTSNGDGLSGITDTQGRTFSVTQVPGDGYIDTITDPTSRTWSYTYGHYDTDYLTTYQDPDGNDTVYDYDSSHRLNQITTPAGNVTKITYDGSSERVASVMRTTDAGHTAGPTTSYAYSSGSPCTTGQNKTVVTDPNSHTITYCSDAGNDRVAKVIDADGRFRSTTYTPNGDVDTGTSTGSSTLAGFATTYQYSSFNSPTQTVRTTGGGSSPTTLTESATYNATGSGCSPSPQWLHFRPDTTTDAQGNVTTLGRDCKGNVTSVRDALTTQNQITLGSYDSQGNPHTSTDANGNATSYGYDTSGRLTSITPPTTTAPSTQLGATAITYDSLSRPHTITDGKGQVTTFDYDVLDRLTQVTYNDGSTEALTYDDDGNATERTDTSGVTTKITDYTYDKLNRLTREDFPDGSSNIYGYDDVGNLASLQDASGTTSYTQENANLLAGETEPGASASYSFGYDGNAFRTSTTFPNGVAQTLSHDGIGRITHIVDKKGTTTLKDLTYSYLKSGGSDSEQVRTLTDNLSGDVTTYTYDVLNRLTDALTKNGSTTVRRYQYTLDGNGNITQRIVTNSAGTTTTTYAYNANNQLCWAYTGTSSNTCGTAPTGATTYSYDANGNQTGTANPTTSSSYNAKNQTTTLLGTTMGYLGDRQNELIADGTASLHNSILDTTSRTLSGTTDYFTRDDQGLLLADRSSSSTKYYLLDPLASVIATTNSSGTVSASYTYDPYGNSIGTAPSPFGYTSGYRTTGGLYHYGARYYNPSDQRWTQPDPLRQVSDPLQADRYAYGGGDPINSTDPSGCKPRISPCVFNCMVQHCDYLTAMQCVYNAHSNLGFIKCVVQSGCRGKFLKCIKDNCGGGGGTTVKIGPFRIPLIIS